MILSYLSSQYAAPENRLKSNHTVELPNWVNADIHLIFYFLGVVEDPKVDQECEHS